MPIESTFKNQLMHALHAAVQNFNDGDSPNDAVAKTAEAYDFNPEQATRLVETFNTARTIYHYKSASDRTSTFELAEPGVVLSKIYKEEQPEEKAASVGSDYDCYDIPEINYQKDMDLDKQGMPNIDIAEPTEFMDTNIDTLTAKSYKALNVQRDLAETARTEATLAGTKAAQILSKVANSLSLGYEEECQDKYNRLMAGYCTQATDRMRDQWAPVMSKLSEFVPAWMAKGAEGVKLANVIDDSDLQNFVGQLKEAKDFMEAEAEMLAVAERIEKDANEFEREFYAAIEPALPPKQAKSVLEEVLSPDFLKRAAEGDTPEDEDDSDGASGVTINDIKEMNVTHEGAKGQDRGSKGRSEGMFSPVYEGIAEAQKQRMTGGLTDTLDAAMERPIVDENKKITERLKNVQRQLMLEDLMVNDPVLSDEDPDTVAQAYQAIVQIAPELSMNKEVVRAVLRSSAQSIAVSPYDAQTWAQLEKTISEVSGKLPARKMEAVKKK